MLKWFKGLYCTDIREYSKEDGIKHEEILKDQKAKEDKKVENYIDDMYSMMEQLVSLEVDSIPDNYSSRRSRRRNYYSSRNDDYSSINTSSSIATTTMLMDSATINTFSSSCDTSSFDSSSCSCDTGSFDCSSF